LEELCTTLTSLNCVLFFNALHIDTNSNSTATTRTAIGATATVIVACRRAWSRVLVLHGDRAVAFIWLSGSVLRLRRMSDVAAVIRSD